MANIKALGKILEVLENVHDDDFDMDVWRGEARNLGGCGSVGCAIGHYIMSGATKELVIDRYGQIGTPKSVKKRGSYSYSVMQSFARISQHLEITRAEAEYLFDPDQYDSRPSKCTVMKRIAEFIEGNLPDETCTKPSAGK